MPISGRCNHVPPTRRPSLPAARPARARARATTAPASTTEPHLSLTRSHPPRLAPRRAGQGAAPLALALLAAGLAGCSPLGWGLRRQPARPTGLGAESREQPALSGDGRLLASLVERGGRTTVLLQERDSGRVLPLPPLRNRQPHSSPSLSWRGRYLALLVQQGPNREPVVLDRATGQLHPLPLPPGRLPLQLSLAADGRRLALDLLDNGQRRVELFDLSGLLEPEPTPGQRVSGGGEAATP